MPAKSEAQRRLFAIAEHKPDILYNKNKKILGSMSKGQMHDFAATNGLKETKPPASAPSSGAAPTTDSAEEETVQPDRYAPRSVAPRSIAPRNVIKTKKVGPHIPRA